MSLPLDYGCFLRKPGSAIFMGNFIGNVICHRKFPMNTSYELSYEPSYEIVKIPASAPVLPMKLHRKIAPPGFRSFSQERYQTWNFAYYVFRLIEHRYTTPRNWKRKYLLIATHSGLTLLFLNKLMVYAVGQQMYCLVCPDSDGVHKWSKSGLCLLGIFYLKNEWCYSVM